MKYIILGVAATVLIILFVLGFVHVGAGAHEHDKGLNAECQVNQSGQDCNEGLICVPFNEHSGNGKCEPVATPTPNCIEQHPDTWEDDCTLVTLTPTEEVSPTAGVSATPTSTVLPPTPTMGFGLPGDGRSDGRSDGLSSCPSCTKAPDNYPKSNYDGANVIWK